MSQSGNAVTRRDEERAVAAARDVVAAPATMQEKFSAATLALSLWTTLPVDTDEGKASVIRHMMGDEAESANAMIGKQFDVEHVVVHSVQGVSEDGEEWDGDRIIMIGPNGESVACVSAGIRRSLQLIMGMYGPPPWTPAMRFELRQIETKRGRRTFNLIPVAQATIAKAEPTKRK